MISKGFLQQSRELVQGQMIDLARRIGDGTPILGLEPSCILALADEWPELVPGNATRAIAAASDLADAWLAKQAEAGRSALQFSPRTEKCLVHGHCHQKALADANKSLALLKRAGYTAELINATCCGMAGSFGYEREHYDVSRAIGESRLFPAVRAKPDAHVAVMGMSCRQQIEHFTGRKPRHLVELLRDAIE